MKRTLLLTFIAFVAVSTSAQAAVFGLTTQGGLGMGPGRDAPFDAEPAGLILGGDFFVQIPNFTWGVGAEVNMLTFSDFTVGTTQFLYGLMRVSGEPLAQFFVDLKLGATWLQSQSYGNSRVAIGWGGGVGYRFTLSPVVDLMPKVGVRVMPVVTATDRVNLLYTDLSLLLSLKLF